MTSNNDFEENLLEGVTMMTSASCPTPDHSAQFTIDGNEGLSRTVGDEDDVFELSSYEDEAE